MFWLITWKAQNLKWLKAFCGLITWNENCVHSNVFDSTFSSVLFKTLGKAHLFVYHTFSNKAIQVAFGDYGGNGCTSKAIKQNTQQQTDK